MAEGDDELLAGAVLPATRRRIGSRNVLDAVWVVLLSVIFVGATFVPLVDLPSTSLRTGTDPFRLLAGGVPIVAALIALVGARLDSSVLVAAATGSLASTIGFVGALSASIFLDDDAAFADVGVAVSFGAAIAGVVAVVRWFVYHPVSIRHDESRPVSPFAYGLGGIGAGTAVVVIVNWVRDSGEFSLQQLVILAFALTPSIVVAVAAVVRTRRAFAVSASAAGIGVVAVLVSRLDISDGARFDVDRILGLWLGVPGVVLMVAAAGVSIAGHQVHRVDDVDDLDDGAERWRWTADD